MSENTIEVTCPRCAKKTIYSTVNKFRPFCSERCKLIDLGGWAAGKYAIPTTDTINPESEIPEDFSNRSQSNSDDEIH